jgi:hypothetical protein
LVLKLENGEEIVGLKTEEKRGNKLKNDKIE